MKPAMQNTLTLTIEINDLTYDSGYGERDCSIVAACTVDMTSKEVTIDGVDMWWIDQDGGEHEAHYSDEFEHLIKDKALNKAQKFGVNI